LSCFSDATRALSFCASWSLNSFSRFRNSSRSSLSRPITVGVCGLLDISTQALDDMVQRCHTSRRRRRRGHLRHLLGNWSTCLIGRRPVCLIDGITVPPDSKLCFESSNVRLETGIGGLYFLQLCLELRWRKLSIDTRSILDGFCANTETKCRKRFGFVVS